MIQRNCRNVNSTSSNTPPIVSDDIEVVGNKSSSEDDAKSYAECPDGYVVKYCEAQSG